ncbi:uncharacterized protein LOC143236789 isoform X1 [Tachypleus tridentatus]|uniref:uncharacterized protein LOC143236789 isoform X1 n=1 Tax=Tachypleus tridentatus TaxID=6853 RepID=UPI003FD3493B
MSAAQKIISNETKHSDERERSEQTQPIDLVQRVSTTSLNLIQSPLQRGVSLHPTVPQPLRSHLEQSKPSFMNLNVRIPSVSPRVPAPAVGSLTVSVTSSQAVGAKVGSPSVIGLQAIPAAGTSGRHTSTATIHAVSGNSPMASIIRAPQSLVGQVTHNINHPYSSHVPRGAAAVASISAAPKSAVATPILRPHSNTSSPVLSSAAVSNHPHPQIIARTPLLRPGRTTTPPISKTASPVPLTITHVIDFKKSGTHIAATGQSQIGLNATKIGDATVRSPAINNKPVHVSQPIVQHLHQVPEKGFSKIQATSVTTAHSTLAQSVPSHRPVAVPQGAVVMRAMTSSTAHFSQQHVLPVSTSHQPVTVPSTTVVSVASLPSVAYAGNYNPTNRQTLHPPSLQAAPHTPNNSSSVGLTSHPTFTVVSTKGASHVVQTVSHHPSQSATSSLGRIVLTTSVSSSNGVRMTTSNASSLRGSASVTPVQHVSAIPVDKVHTKVYPQLSNNSRASSESLPNSGNEIISQPNRMNTVIPVSAISGTTPQTLSGSNHHSSFESKSESNTSGTTRLASVPQPGFAGGTQYAVPAAAYYYESYPVHSGVTMQHFSNSSGTSNYTANVVPSSGQRPGILSPHVTTNIASQGSAHNFSARGSTGPSVRSLSSVMVNIDSRHHVAFHPLFTTANKAGISTDVLVTVASPTNSLCTSASTTVSAVSLTNSSLVSSPHGTLHGTGSLPNLSTSPRPSILRKRTIDGVSAAVKKNLLASMSGSAPASPRTETSATPHGCELGKEFSIHGQTKNTDYTEGIKKQLSSVGDVVKQEPQQTSENAWNAAASVTPEVSPRKKPRKQQLAANELIGPHSSDGEEELDKNINENNKKEDTDREEPVKWVTFCKRPSMSLLSSYRHTWKSRHNHFQRYSDVKPKDEKKTTVNDLANQKGVLQKSNGWKFYHLSAQLEEVVELEVSVYSRISKVLDLLENDPPALKCKPLSSDEDRVMNKINDLIKGNLQRSKLLQDQMTEAKQQMLKILEHKPSIVEIINKYASKRPLKKKEKS